MANKNDSLERRQGDRQQFSPGRGSRAVACVVGAIFYLTAQFALAEDALDRTVTLDIRENSPLEDALIDWGIKAGMTVMIDTHAVAHQRAHKLQGSLTARQALTLLLSDSGLSYSEVGGRIRIVPATDTSLARDVSTSLTILSPDTASTHRLANDGEESGGTSTIPHEDRYNEVIVTAQKRDERLQDVPAPVSVVNTESLLVSNQVRFDDYYSSVPNLTVAPTIQSQQGLTIRGVNSGGGAPTVGVLVDDVPYGSVGAGGGGYVLPDIDPGDLARIEVLRGPQGTLYGASAMGGLLKFVTADPSTDKVAGRLQAGLSHVTNGDGLGYSVRGSLNLPVTDTFAMRASGFHREDPGYIDDPFTGVKGVNRENVNGGHLAFLWRPYSDLSVKLSALVQQSKGDGSNEVHVLPTLSDLQQNNIRGAGAFERQIQAYSAVVNAKVGKADLASITGYSVNDMHDSFDFSYALGPLGATQFGASGVPVFDDIDNHKVSQELRLSMPLTSRLDWMLGVFYTHERLVFVQNVLAVDPLTAVPAGLLERAGTAFPQTYYWELAGFTDFTIHFTDKFQIQLGGRESKLSVPSTESATTGAPIFGLSATPIMSHSIPYDANVFTYLATPQYKFSEDMMVYARFASGYRPGGANCPETGCVGTTVGATQQYSPDKTDDYEIGLKGEFLDHTLDVDTSFYYIDWKDVQIGLITPDGAGYTANAGAAKSQGAEISVASRPLPGLKLSAWVAFNDAQLTQPFPQLSQVHGAAGDPLPLSSRFSTNFSIDQSFPLYKDLSGFVGASVAYIGERLGSFQALQPVGTPQRQSLPAYAKLDFLGGIQVDTWSVNVSVVNATDRRGVLSGGAGGIPPYAFYYITPRTATLSVIKTF